MDENNKISETLAGYTPKLSQAEKDALWNKIDTQLGNSTPTLSPYLFIFNRKKHMAPIALALMLMLGTTGIVAASETARPGDSLFVIEQKVEELRLALASDEAKTRLEAQFAAERLLELSSILNESVKKDGRTVTASSTSSFEAEADVFADTTIVEVELGDTKTVFETTANTRDEVVLEIMSRFGLARGVVESRLDFEVEDRGSRDDDKAKLTISGENEARVNEAVAITLSYLLNGSFDTEQRDELLAELSILLEGVPVKMNSQRMRLQDTNSWVEIRNDDEDNSRIEIRDDENRIRIREKDGEIRIDTRTEDDDDFEDGDEDDRLLDIKSRLNLDIDDQDNDRDDDEDDDRNSKKENRSDDEDDRDEDDNRLLNVSSNLNLNVGDNDDDNEDDTEDSDDDSDDEDEDDRD